MPHEAEIRTLNFGVGELAHQGIAAGEINDFRMQKMSENRVGASRAINCNAAQPHTSAMGKAYLASQPLSEPIRHLLFSSLSENSQRAFRADLAHLHSSGLSIPCTPEMVVEYLAAVAYTHAVATIQRRLSTIAKAHKAITHDDPTKAEIVKATMRGIRRVRGVAQREAQALTRDDLFMVLERTGSRPIDIRDRALLLIGFAGAFRRSELVGLNFGDVEQVRQGVILHLRRSKTDQLGKGRKIAVPNGRTHWCPVQHLADWLNHAEIDDGPIFRSINRHGQLSTHRLSGDAVSTIIKRRVTAAGFDPAIFSGHSLRAGLATSAAMVGTAPWKIRQQTGHASDAMLTRYIRVSDLFAGNAAGAVL